MVAVLLWSRAVLQALVGVDLTKPVGNNLICERKTFIFWLLDRNFRLPPPTGVAGVGHVHLQDARLPDQPGPVRHLLVGRHPRAQAPHGHGRRRPHRGHIGSPFLNKILDTKKVIVKVGDKWQFFSNFRISFRR